MQNLYGIIVCRSGPMTLYVEPRTKWERFRGFVDDNLPALFVSVAVPAYAIFLQWLWRL